MSSHIKNGVPSVLLPALALTIQISLGVAPTISIVSWQAYRLVPLARPPLAKIPRNIPSELHRCNYK